MLNISTLHSNVLDLYEKCKFRTFTFKQNGLHNSVYSANDGRKFIHASTDEGSCIGGCFKKEQKTKLQKKPVTEMAFYLCVNGLNLHIRNFQARWNV